MHKNNKQFNGEFEITLCLRQILFEPFGCRVQMYLCLNAHAYRVYNLFLLGPIRSSESALDLLSKL